MKQYITEEQFWELGGENSIGEKRLLEWMRSKNYYGYEGEGNYYFFLPTIGQMIEFLGEHDNLGGEDITASLVFWGLDHRDYEKLCDHLWEAVKEILNAKA